MKKILLVFLFTLTVFVPSIGLAATVELNVVISHVYIPERAGMILAPDRPNTEFIIGNGSITATDKNSTIVLRTAGSKGQLIGGQTATASFPYDASLAPYNVYAEFRVVSADGGCNYGADCNLCAADCSQLPAGTGYFTTDVASYYGLGYILTTGGGMTAARCPNNCGTTEQYYPYDLREYLGVSSDHVISSGYYYYWRSPSLLTIQ